MCELVYWWCQHPFSISIVTRDDAGQAVRLALSEFSIQLLTANSGNAPPIPQAKRLTERDKSHRSGPDPVQRIIESSLENASNPSKANNLTAKTTVANPRIKYWKRNRKDEHSLQRTRCLLRAPAVHSIQYLIEDESSDQILVEGRGLLGGAASPFRGRR